MMKPEEYIAEQFDDIRILRYEVPAFERLPLDRKIFIYYLSQAALAGRDIIWDQNNKYNLRIRKVFEKIIKEYSGERNTDEFEHFLLYAQKVFFSNGIHHHYSMNKFTPGFTMDYFHFLSMSVGEEVEDLDRILFDPDYMSKRVVLDEGWDLIQSSANNYYSGVMQKEVEAYYDRKKKSDTRVSVGLNSTLIKRDGKIEEEVWRVDGKYGSAIEQIMYWLEMAQKYAHTEQQKQVITLLIDYYRTGDLKLFDDYSIAWVKESESDIDFINGFIEVYGDPLAYKASWESVVEIVDKEAGERTRRLAEKALWFEDNAPIDPRFKKKEISGVTARVVQVAMLGGDCHPATPIGINLPNAEWIREEYGSKSVTLDNITYAYYIASLRSGVTDEFAYLHEEKELAKQYGYIGGNVHTDLHECLGHGSGKMLPGVSTDKLKNYYSTIEETRADLFALYYIMDPELTRLGIIPHPDVAKCEYAAYIRNGLLTQLTRIKLGDNLEESHMRNRQLIASWVYEQGKSQQVIKRLSEEGKTYFVIHDYAALRMLFGKLLWEIQRIKSEGDYEGAKYLVEMYGVKVDRRLHEEVLERYEKLQIPPYAGFINPEYRLVKRENVIVDVEISYPENFLAQMLSYGEAYSFL